MALAGTVRAAALAASWGCAFGGIAAHAADRPNILLIVADDMGYSDASPYGGEIFTPNIARLADQGTMFTNFHVAAYCAPTRSMLMTGVDNHRVGLGNMVELLADNQRGRPGYEGRLNGAAATIATTLRAAGYHTYMAGKWHLGKTPETIPAGQGFEKSVGVLEGGADNYENKSYSPGYAKVHFFEDRGELKLPPHFYSTRFYTDRLIADIDAGAADGKPFFGYLAYQAVHQPHQAPLGFTARYVTTYEAGWSAISSFRYQRQVEMGVMPPGLAPWASPRAPDWAKLTPEQQRDNASRMAVYAGMLEYMDMSIGRLLDHLRAKRMLDNTIVVFMSDNGGEAVELQPMFPDYYAKHFDLGHARRGEKGTYSEYGPGWAAASGTPFSNYKGSAAEGGMRAPLVIRYPGHVEEGQRTAAFAYVLDVVPTLLDLAGVTPTANAAAPLDGTSMTALLAGHAPTVHPPTQPIGYEVAGSAALFLGDMKLVRNAPPYGDFRWRLYDLDTDPTEQHDLSASSPRRSQEMVADYTAYMERNGGVEVPPGYNVLEQGRANAAKQH